jgi:hypothetical protein
MDKKIRLYYLVPLEKRWVTYLIVALITEENMGKEAINSDKEWTLKLDSKTVAALKSLGYNDAEAALHCFQAGCEAMIKDDTKAKGWDIHIDSDLIKLLDYIGVKNQKALLADIRRVVDYLISLKVIEEAEN